MAYLTRSLIDRSRSFLMMLVRWDSTVFTLMPSVAATSLLLRDSATSWMICLSLGVVATLGGSEGS